MTGDDERTPMTATTYGGVHRALKQLRGSAVGRPCIAPGCGEPSKGWGLVGRPTTIGVDSRRRIVRYSQFADDYEPLCNRHNSLLDGGGSWSLCPKGHVRALWGQGKTGGCLGCSREDSYRRYRRNKTSRQQAGTTPAPGIELEQNGG